MYRPILALYIGGMGAREVNFHNNVFARMGYEGDAKLIQDLYLDGKKAEAAAAVPTQLVEDVALVGPREKIRDDLEMWRESTVTTMVVRARPSSCATSRSSFLDEPAGVDRGRGAGRSAVSWRRPSRRPTTIRFRSTR